MPPADPPAAAPPPAERPARRRRKRRPPKTNPNPATRRRAPSPYSVKATVSLEPDLHADLVDLAQAWDITFPEAMRQVARAGLAAIRERRDEEEMDRALREFDPGAGSRSDPAANGDE